MGGGQRGPDAVLLRDDRPSGIVLSGHSSRCQRGLLCYPSGAEFRLGSYTSMDDVTFPVGTAFLGNFGTKTVRPTYAGQVVDGAVEMDCTGKQYVMFGNPVPRAITLGEIVMDGGDATGDNVQVLDRKSVV